MKSLAITCTLITMSKQSYYYLSSRICTDSESPRGPRYQYLGGMNWYRGCFIRSTRGVSLSVHVCTDKFCTDIESLYIKVHNIIINGYQLKYALKMSKYALKTPKYALKNTKTSTTIVKTITNKNILLQKAKKNYKMYLPKSLFQTC